VPIVVDMVTDLRVPQNVGHFFPSWAIISLEGVRDINAAFVCMKRQVSLCGCQSLKVTLPKEKHTATLALNSSILDIDINCTCQNMLL
jgi:hypothetical protein